MVTTRLHRFSREKEFLKTKLKGGNIIYTSVDASLITKYVPEPGKRKSKEELLFTRSELNR